MPTILSPSVEFGLDRCSGVAEVIALQDDLLPVVAVLSVKPALHAAAQTAYRASLPSGASFVGQVSFAVMARESIETAFALDDDFAAAAVTVIPTP